MSRDLPEIPPGRRGRRDGHVLRKMWSGLLRMMHDQACIMEPRAVALCLCFP